MKRISKYDYIDAFLFFVFCLFVVVRLQFPKHFILLLDVAGVSIMLMRVLFELVAYLKSWKRARHFLAFQFVFLLVVVFVAIAI